MLIFKASWSFPFEKFELYNFYRSSSEVIWFSCVKAKMRHINKKKVKKMKKNKFKEGENKMEGVGRKIQELFSLEKSKLFGSFNRRILANIFLVS